MRMLMAFLIAICFSSGCATVYSEPVYEFTVIKKLDKPLKEHANVIGLETFDINTNKPSDYSSVIQSAISDFIWNTGLMPSYSHTEKIEIRCGVSTSLGVPRLAQDWAIVTTYISYVNLKVLDKINNIILGEIEYRRKSGEPYSSIVGGKMLEALDATAKQPGK